MYLLLFVNTGYSITVGGPRGCKKPCVIAMQHPGLHTTFMSVLDQNELNVWFNALERGTKMENTLQHVRKPAEGIAVSGNAVKVEITPCEPAVPTTVTTKNKKTVARDHSAEVRPMYEAYLLQVCFTYMYIHVFSY